MLRALLGLTPRARAALRLGDTDVTALPPHRRGVAWVPQDGALFPHLNALHNTAYGLRAHGTPRGDARRTAQQWLDRLGVGHLAHRKPAQLSGGQAQRVALARALAARPRLLLLDEPLAALDQTTRAQVRHTLRGHLADFGGVCLIVTHDPVEAVSLADRVLVLDDGRALQDAPPAEVTRHPRSPWVARMLGRNAWPGTVTGEALALTDGGRLVIADPLPDGARALAIIAPEAVSLHVDRPTGSPRNVWPGTVRELTSMRQSAAGPCHLARGARSGGRNHPLGGPGTRPGGRCVRMGQRQGHRGLGGDALTVSGARSVRLRATLGASAGHAPSAHGGGRSAAVSVPWPPVPARTPGSAGPSSSGTRRNRGTPRRRAPTTGPSPPR